MAGTSVYHTHGAQEINIVELFVKAAIGATGAVTINTSASKGIESITRNDTGDYTILLKEAYNSLLMTDIMLLEADDTDLTHQVISEDVVSGKTVKIGFHAAATPTDPPDGSTIYVRITLKNSSV
jgi:hypothetical protein